MTWTPLRAPEMCGPILGARLIEITDSSKEEDREQGVDFVHLHFDNGYTLVFPIDNEGDGFEVQEP